LICSASLECANDIEAKKRAEELAVAHDVELWRDDRRIARYNHKAPTFDQIIKG
jgi:hypothetical protein